MAQELVHASYTDDARLSVEVLAVDEVVLAEVVVRPPAGEVGARVSVHLPTRARLSALLPAEAEALCSALARAYENAEMLNARYFGGGS